MDTILNIILYIALYNIVFTVLYTVTYTTLYTDTKNGIDKYNVYITEHSTVNLSHYPSVHHSVHFTVNYNLQEPGKGFFLRE